MSRYFNGDFENCQKMSWNRMEAQINDSVLRVTEDYGPVQTWCPFPGTVSGTKIDVVWTRQCPEL